MTVPAQFMGMAHAFLYSIENLIPHGDLARSLAKTLARGNQIRPEQMAQMAAILSRPYPGTLHCEIAWNRQKTRVQIGAVRAVRSCLALTQWSPGHPVRDLTVANSEHVCDLYYLQTSISKKQMTNRVELLATVGEHALGRYFQRSLRSEGGLTADLAAVAYAAAQIDLPLNSDLSRADVPCRVDTPSGGCWLGCLRTLHQPDDPRHGHWVIVARTFISNFEHAYRPTAAEACAAAVSARHAA